VTEMDLTTHGIVALYQEVFPVSSSVMHPQLGHLLVCIFEWGWQGGSSDTMFAETCVQEPEWYLVSSHGWD
jgi:hypothetical protein